MYIKRNQLFFLEYDAVELFCTIYSLRYDMGQKLVDILAATQMVANIYHSVGGGVIRPHCVYFSFILKYFMYLYSSWSFMLWLTLSSTEYTTNKNNFYIYIINELVRVLFLWCVSVNISYILFFSQNAITKIMMILDERRRTQWLLGKKKKLFSTKLSQLNYIFYWKFVRALICHHINRPKI